MSRIATLVLALLVACSPSFSTRVDAFDTPIANTLGRICWVKVDAGSAPPIRTAAFRANATYDPGALALTDRVEIQVFGRPDAPASECTGRDERRDVPLSEPFELEREARQAVVVGGASYGADLADLVGRGAFWLGASAAGNVAVGEERVLFEDGRITVGF